MTRRKRTRKRTKPLVASWEEVEVRSVVGERVGILWLLGTMMMMTTTVGGKGSAVSSGGVEIANHHTHDHIILFHHPNPRKTGSATRTPHTTYTSRCDGLKASYSMNCERWETGQWSAILFRCVWNAFDNLGFFDFKRLMPASGKEEGGIIIRNVGSHTHLVRVHL